MLARMKLFVSDPISRDDDLTRYPGTGFSAVCLWTFFGFLLFTHPRKMLKFTALSLLSVAAADVGGDRRLNSHTGWQFAAKGCVTTKAIYNKAANGGGLVFAGPFDTCTTPFGAPVKIGCVKGQSPTIMQYNASDCSGAGTDIGASMGAVNLTCTEAKSVTIMQGTNATGCADAKALPAPGETASELGYQVQHADGCNEDEDDNGVKISLKFTCEGQAVKIEEFSKVDCKAADKATTNSHYPATLSLDNTVSCAQGRGSDTRCVTVVPHVSAMCSRAP